MERFTIFNPNGTAIGTKYGLIQAVIDGCLIGEVIDKLGEYEDSEFTPEEIKYLIAFKTNPIKFVMELNELKNKYNSLLDLQQADAWIPLTERLPENDKSVLTCDLYGNIHIVNHIKEYRHPFNISPENKRYHEAIAWMPLPEPYDALEAGIKRVLDREHRRISGE